MAIGWYLAGETPTLADATAAERLKRVLARLVERPELSLNSLHNAVGDLVAELRDRGVPREWVVAEAERVLQAAQRPDCSRSRVRQLRQAVDRALYWFIAHHYDASPRVELVVSPSSQAALGAD